MSITYSGGSLKELHKRKKSIEDLTKENDKLKERLQAAEDDLTNTQVALTDVYEMLLNGGAANG